MARPMNSPRILAYLVTEDWYFVSHRLPMARAARDAGYQVHVLTNVRRHGAAIEAEGFQLHPLPWRRGSLNPFRVLAVIGEVRRLYRQLNPDLVHHVALQPSIVGSLAALGLPIPCLNALTGMGYAFSSHGIRAAIMRPIFTGLLRFLLNRRRAAVLVQNPDDGDMMLGLGIDVGKVFRIAGSGVDTEKLLPLPEPAGPPTAAYVGRLLEYKGLPTLIAAFRLLAQRGRDMQLLIAGEPDPANPNSIPRAEVESWRDVPGVVLLGHVEAIETVWRKAHIAVLASRREGLPLSLLEAAACGRAIVASDVAGCREIAQAGVNAELVPPDDPEALAGAIERLASDAGRRRKFAEAGRRLVEQKFSSAQIGREIVALYDRLAAARS